ncbi:L-asparaginase [Heyndrickxia sporothermodurans]|nr:L-asparaginase [Heyndrickxia sporothermodurans]PTY78663.1 L-asparaginase [Heyndrickxia sporothermodurans]PTY82627.1 L-asparaginase [Heyndrickxia sporothermodurans]PTY83916.1 L-asparaginase [Heyndrickxia sporothermodurans]
MMKKNILVVHTGGTISMFEDSETGAVKPGNENPLSTQTKGLNNLANLIIKEPFNLPSPHITMQEMLQLKKIIEDEVNQNKIEGVVITHGTDTLEETAYFLDLTIDLEIPIVVTGAMRSSNEIGSDGLYNLITSIRVAACDDAKGKGVLVVLNDEIHTAENVTKTHASNVSTFQSPQYGPIGIITKQGVFFHNTPTHKEKYDIDQISKRVALLKAHAGMDSLLFHSILDLQYDGIVIEALGQGNMPPDTVEGIKSLIEANIPTIIVSRCFNGIAQDIYGYNGGGKQLKELGAIFSNGLNGQKARIKLLIALSQTNDMKVIEEMFH